MLVHSFTPTSASPQCTVVLRDEFTVCMVLIYEFPFRCLSHSQQSLMPISGQAARRMDRECAAASQRSATLGIMKGAEVNKLHKMTFLLRRLLKLLVPKAGV